MMKIEKGNIVVIGNDITDVVRWVEKNAIYGLYTGFEVDEVNDQKIKINGYEEYFNEDNVYQVFKTKNEYFEWLKDYVEKYSELELNNIDYNDFIYE